MEKLKYNDGVEKNNDEVQKNNDAMDQYNDEVEKRKVKREKIEPSVPPYESQDQQVKREKIEPSAPPYESQDQEVDYSDLDMPPLEPNEMPLAYPASPSHEHDDSPPQYDSPPFNQAICMEKGNKVGQRWLYLSFLKFRSLRDKFFTTLTKLSSSCCCWCNFFNNL